MKKLVYMKKSLILLIVLAFFLLFSVETSTVSADVFTDIDIDKYEATLVFDNNGDMHVKETWHMDYSERYSVRFRDVEYRKFPSDYPLPYSEDNKASFNESQYSIGVYIGSSDLSSEVRVGYSFNEDMDELGETVACPPNAESLCESIFINFNRIGGLEGEIQIEYNYIIENVVTEYSDVSEINWVLFDYAESGVDTGTINIILPDNTNDVDDINIFTALIRHSEVEVKSNKSITIDFENMRRTDQLGFRLLVPTNTFSSISNNSIFIHEDMNRQVIVDFEEQLAFENSISSILVYVLIGISILVIIYYGYVIDKLNKTVFAPHKTLDLDKVVNIIPTEHKPAIVGYLYRNRTSSDEDISATLLDLVSRGYLIVDDSKVFNDPDYSLDDLIKGEQAKIKEIEDPYYYVNSSEPILFNKTYEKIEENFDMDLVLNKNKSLDDLEPYEFHLIDWYINDVGDGDKVSTKEMSKLDDIEESANYVTQSAKFDRLVKESCADIQYYDDLSKEITNSSKQLFPVGIFLIITVVCGVLFKTNIIAPIIIYMMIIVSFLIYSNTRRRKTSFIQDFYEKWTKYKNNLKTLNVLKTASISDVDFWDNNLIYATVFGIADEVLVQLKSVYVANASESKENNRTTVRHNNYYYHSYWHRHMRTYHRKVLTKSTVNIRPTTSHRGGSGFGGGGSFGGGGGGGRSR